MKAKLIGKLLFFLLLSWGLLLTGLAQVVEENVVTENDTNYDENSLLNPVELQITLSQLVDALASLEEVQASNYETKYENAIYCMDLLLAIEAAHENLRIDITNRIQAGYAQALVNPTSDIFLNGSFINIVNKTLEETLTSVTSINQEEKDRLRSNLTSLISSLGQAFPPIAVVSTAISAFSSFTTLEQDTTYRKDKISYITSRIVNPINSEIVKEFTSKISPYVLFYGELNETNNEIVHALDDFESRLSEMEIALDTLKFKIEKDLGVDFEGDENYVLQIQSIFEVSTSRRNYAQLNGKEEIKALPGILRQTLDEAESFFSFSSDYNKLIISELQSKHNLVKKYQSGSNNILNSSNPTINFYLNEVNIKEKQKELNKSAQVVNKKVRNLKF
jgi:hypothetical protein